MSTAEEQDRLLQGPRSALERARQDPATWADLAYCAQMTDEGPITDRNTAARFAVLWALQYDRRPQDLPLLRFLLQQQATYYREAVPWGMAPDLTLAGFMVAEHRRVEDLWLHWNAKSISFDTALGYHLYHLLTAGIAAATETVRTSSHPDRDRILGNITSARHTDAAVEEWLDQQRTRFPSDPAVEGLKSWAHHAARLGEREASRLFMTEWAAGEPRTGDTLNTRFVMVRSQGEQTAHPGSAATPNRRLRGRTANTPRGPAQPASRQARLRPRNMATLRQGVLPPRCDRPRRLNSAPTARRRRAGPAWDSSTLDGRSPRRRNRGC